MQAICYRTRCTEKRPTKQGNLPPQKQGKQRDDHQWERKIDARVEAVMVRHNEPLLKSQSDNANCRATQKAARGDTFPDPPDH